jgi:DNA-binding CsgD family transcriptional regulator
VVARPPRVYRVTRRQREALHLISIGLTVAQAGRQLGITENSVKSLLRNLYKKLNVGTGTEAVRIGFETGLLTPRVERIAEVVARDVVYYDVTDDSRPDYADPVVDNQHKLISGYRDLSEREVDAVNAIKALEHEVGELWKQVRDDVTGSDPAALSIARDQLKTGFSWFVRAVARPADPFE